jgi:uncharacterized protein YpiB (UPF0302 family)
MKTAEDKAIALLEKTPVHDIQYNRLLRAITMALKEQDRETRHACVEAVNSLHPSSDGGWISKNVAASACMNARAV